MSTANREKNGEKKKADVSADRVLSVDVLRGFDMFWIIGGAEIVSSLSKFGENPILAFFSNQLKHRDWDGFVFEDLIFPLFLFMVGMAVVFSVGKIVEREGMAQAHKRIFRRFALMFLLGVFYSGGISGGVDQMRIMGVLQRLALGYLFTSLMFCHLKPKHMAIICVSLLLGYWAWLTFIPVPDIGRVSFAKGENWANYIDKIALPFRKHDGDWDPEGILSTFPAIATCLFGCFAGLYLMNEKTPAEKKGIHFIMIGIALAAAGYLWGMQFPVIKKIWSSSFVLVAGGYSCILLGIFYQVIDVWKIRAWTTPFLWIGSNALAVYMTRNMVDFRKIAERFIGSPEAAPSPVAHLAVTCISLGMVLLFARFLYKKKVFIRI